MTGGCTVSAAGRLHGCHERPHFTHQVFDYCSVQRISTQRGTTSSQLCPDLQNTLPISTSKPTSKENVEPSGPILPSQNGFHAEKSSHRCTR